MDGCIKCKPIKNIYDTIGVTYYELTEDKSVLCYRHWHQAGRPKSKVNGEYSEVFTKYKKKYENF